MLRIEPDNHGALVTLLRALTDQFQDNVTLAETRKVVASMADEYERAYYSGIICERRAKALLHQGIHGSASAIYDWIREAMTWYEQAEAIRPPANDDALLRWNTCARLLMRHPHLQPAPEQQTEPIMSE